MTVSRRSVVVCAVGMVVATGVVVAAVTLRSAWDESGPLVPSAWTTPAPDRSFSPTDTGAPTSEDRAYWDEHGAENAARAGAAHDAALAAWQAEQDRLAAEAAAAAAAAQAQAQAETQAAAAQPAGARTGNAASSGGGATSGGGGAASGGGGQSAAPTLPPSGTQAIISGKSCAIHDGHYDLTFTVSFDNGYRQGPITMHNTDTYLGDISTGGNWYPAWSQFDCPAI